MRFSKIPAVFFSSALHFAEFAVLYCSVVYCTYTAPKGTLSPCGRCGSYGAMGDILRIIPEAS